MSRCEICDTPDVLLPCAHCGKMICEPCSERYGGLTLCIRCDDERTEVDEELTP